MLQTRLDDKDFGPVLPAVRLALACLAYGALGYLFFLDTRNTVAYNPPVTTGFVVERALIFAFGLLVFSFVVLHLLLARRLRFSESGIVRRTVFRPRFVQWKDVTGARLASYKGSVSLELKVVGRRLWITVPLSEYRRPASLLSEIRRRLGVEVQHADGPLAERLKDA